jgi:uncharacterized protein
MQARHYLASLSFLFLTAVQQGAGMAQGPGPGFNCTSVTAPTLERIVCNSDELSRLDAQMAKLYRDALPEPDDTARSALRNAMRAEQSSWRESRLVE